MPANPHHMPDWPAAMSIQRAAAYCDFASVDSFKKACPVKPVRLYSSARTARYLRADLDNWLLSLKNSRPANGWGDSFGGESGV